MIRYREIQDELGLLMVKQNKTKRDYARMEKLYAEQDRIASNPTWFFRELLAEGHQLGEDFERATAWVDDAAIRSEE